MNWIVIIGLSAAFCTTISFFPQAYHTIRTKDTSGLSLIMYSIFSFGIVLWLVYGIVISDAPIVIANICTLIPTLTILVLKIRHK